MLLEMIKDSKVTNIQPVSTTEMGRRSPDRMMIRFISTYDTCLT
jgi:hypothetical protein